MYAIMHWRMIKSEPIAKVSFGNSDFPLADMTNHCHTEAFYGSLNKEETQKFIDKCHEQGVTVTSAISSAILSAIVNLVTTQDNQQTRLTIAIAADTRRRCTPVVPNHDLSYHVAGTLAFTMLTRDAPTTAEGMWQVATAFAQYLQNCIEANQILTLGMIMGKLYQKNLDPPDPTKLPTCGISSWGLLPFQERYGKWELVRMIPGCNLISAPMPMVLLQTVNGILTVACMGTRSGCSCKYSRDFV